MKQANWLFHAEEWIEAATRPSAATATAGRWLWMVCRFRRFLHTILGSWLGQIVRCIVCWNFGNIPVEFDGGRIVDTGHSVCTLLSASPIVQCTVPTFLMPFGSLCWWPILCTWTDTELFCNQPISFALHIWNIDGYLLYIAILNIPMIRYALSNIQVLAAACQPHPASSLCHSISISIVHWQMGYVYRALQRVVSYFQCSSNIWSITLDFMVRFWYWVDACCMYAPRPRSIGHWKWTRPIRWNRVRIIHRMAVDWIEEVDI